ncbi:hypothetical protein [Plantactinospora soyae]|uniref:Uncharacterized protein n=1 Tax=Plantactinospora soyae TaxID=1544732 RepID=A0A927QXL6_9ACTN|nr:hypothetical protein [Plantactinospora soyae]MBE1485608.1 hypothetical protein [Plantactinospora soyae]
MVTEMVVLVGGPGAGQQVEVAGGTVVWRSCLYERTGEHRRMRGVEVRAHGHRPDCCEGHGRGDTDVCE